MRYILIPADVDSAIGEGKIDGHDDTYGVVFSHLRSLVGGWIEMVHTQQLNSLLQVGELRMVARDVTVTMVVDEEGAPNCKNYPVNSRASKFYDGQIYGPAVLIGEYLDPEGGTFRPLPDHVTVEFLQERLAAR